MLKGMQMEVTWNILETFMILIVMYGAEARTGTKKRN
jgi:hypothetical protein